jgi:hypothetical protein
VFAAHVIRSYNRVSNLRWAAGPNERKRSGMNTFFNDDDFEFLSISSTDLQSEGRKPGHPDAWPDEDMDGKPFSEDRWRYLYSFDSTAALALARAFLRFQGSEYQIICSEGADDDDPWLVFTNYQTPTWRRIQADQN